MSSKDAPTTRPIPKARATYSIRPLDISKILCTRLRQGRERYLIRWRSEPDLPVPPRAICSWHDLEELTLGLHHVQTYLETRKRPDNTLKVPAAPFVLQGNRKRKSPDSDPISLPSRDPRLGILTPGPTSSPPSRATSVLSRTSSTSSTDGEIEIYNGVLERKEGWIVAKKSKHVKVIKINATNLPTPSMLEEAATTPVTQTERAIREAFHRKLRSVPQVSLENKIDNSTPSLNFKFISEYVLGEGVERYPDETIEGCSKPCRPNMGQYIGCELPARCACLEYAAVDTDRLANSEPIIFEQYQQLMKTNAIIDIPPEKLPKRFPYQKSKGDSWIPQTLQRFYLESRNPIYECNKLCHCGPVCKSRVVQKGRKVPLTIFKTPNRGWGLYCQEDLVVGEFVDTYIGEVITNAEADHREERAGTKEKASYLYSLDKFVGDDDDLTPESCYVVDGQYMGGPTRFINHSCEPNCRQFTVSYNKNDRRVYDLAFFAIDNIAAGTELTFDYMDRDEEEDEEFLRKRGEAADDPTNLDKRPCNCGASKCRGYLWV